MEKKIYKTLIKANQKYGKNEYIKGKISGIESVICEEPVDGGYAIHLTEKGSILTVKCTEEQYERFRMYVAEMYPGLCDFNYID